jgi:hypothetical protein
VIDDLVQQRMGIKEGFSPFFGEIMWGNTDGAVKLTFSPYRGLHAVIRKLTHDLQGETVWVCKKVVEVGNIYDKKPDVLIMELYKTLEDIDQTAIEAPSPDYKKFEAFVLHLAHMLKTNTTQKPLYYTGIRRVDEGKNYIIHFGVKGMGVQALGQRRVNQVQIEVQYKKDRGLIQITCNDLGSKLDADKWELSPSQFNEYFMPSQDEDEIITAILHHLNMY